MDVETAWESYFRLGAGEGNQKLRRASLRLFGTNQKRAAHFQKRYYQQQGLLQIYADFCLEDFSDCAHCSFPEQLRQWQAGSWTTSDATNLGSRPSKLGKIL
jgi:hypothetical protein